MSTNEQREERAFEALIVETVRQVDSEPANIDAIRPPTEKEKAALRRVDDGGFIESLVAGEIDEASESCGPPENGTGSSDLALTGDTAGAALFRTDDVDDEVADELDELDREIIERKMRERKDGETS